MRRGQAEKRDIAPDLKYKNPTVAKFVNYVMHGGKKSVAQKVVYGAFDIIEKETKKDPIVVFDEALSNVSPAQEVKSRRKGGANYQVPIPVRMERRSFLAMNWIIAAARKKTGSSMDKRLAAELITASKNEGTAIKRKEDMHRMAQANKAFAHFR